MNPEIERDPYLRPVAERWSEAAAFEAGWFEDADPDDAPLDDVGWLITPIDIVQQGGAPVPPGSRELAGAVTGSSPVAASPVVLLSTGGFFPVHRGHLAMMGAARGAVEAGGGTVIGGYLSPAHDDYIALKCGRVDVPVSERLARADATVAPTGWLSIDPWEALARRVAVNYTDVAARLETYLRVHVDPAIEVVYVCGGDNARFSLAFTERGGCVVVGRPGNEATVARWRADPRVADNPRIRWVDGDDPASSSALRARPPTTPTNPTDPSTAATNPSNSATAAAGAAGATATVTSTAGRSVRPGDQAATQPGAGATASPDDGGDGGGAVTTGRPHRGGEPGPGDKRRLTLRLEDERAVATLGLPASAWRQFQDGLQAELAIRAALRTVTLATQDEAARTTGTISLDPMLPAEIDVGISRVFDLGGYRALRHTARPGSAPLAEQLAAIPPGSWSLRDDDRATGATVRFVAGHLPRGVTLTATTFALTPDATTEIADSRDFLLGTDDGGLVVALPHGTIGRAPYLLPYVDPAVRSGLPAGDAITFSLALWELNAAVFATTARTVADLPAPVARTLAVAGFHPTATLAAVCTHHASVLRSLLPLT